MRDGERLRGSERYGERRERVRERDIETERVKSTTPTTDYF